MEVSLEFTLNGKSERISSEAKRTLLEVLREDLDLTGTKYGCGEGQCRACTVLIDGRPTRSCLTDIEEISGKSVETIESLAHDGKLHPVQQAFIDRVAMQCGYCVPGMILSTVALLKRNPSPSPGDIAEGLNGNLCRCCGYINVVSAVQHAAHLLKEVK